MAKECLANLPDGVRPVDTSATCRVLLEVTDNNDGTLTSKVTYRDGTENGKIVFHNTHDKVKTIGTVAEPNVDIDGQLLSVGDSYVYTINWANTAVDADGNLVPANVTVTDELPTGVVFEAFEASMPIRAPRAASRFPGTWANSCGRLWLGARARKDYRGRREGRPGCGRRRQQCCHH